MPIKKNNEYKRDCWEVYCLEFDDRNWNRTLAHEYHFLDYSQNNVEIINANINMESYFKSGVLTFMLAQAT